MTLRDLLFGSGATSRATDLGLLVLRFGIGIPMLLAHGIGKIPPSDGFIEGTAAMGFPLPVLFAWAAALAETVGGLFVAIGLLTRPSAFFVAFTMGVAFFVRHGEDPFGERELAFVFLVGFLAVMVAGAGRYAVDGWIRQREAA
ncbi:MAG: DoxX family protein [Bacteroidota bacterium]